MFIDLSHSRWDRFFTDTCSIETTTEGEVNDLGEVETSRAALEGHEALKCQFATKTGTIKRDNGELITVQTIEIGLRGYYPQIKADMTAIVAGDRYKVIVPKSDSQHVKTILIVEAT